MTPRQAARWERARARGWLHYVLVRGIAGYGLPMFAIMTFLVHRERLDTRLVALSAVLWALGGAVFGAVTWWVQERRWRMTPRA